LRTPKTQLLCTLASTIILYEKLKEARLRIKERKMVPVNGRQWNSHCNDPDNLKGRYQGQTGKEFFRGFFDRCFGY
jgi:hypothetical protein